MPRDSWLVEILLPVPIPEDARATMPIQCSEISCIDPPSHFVVVRIAGQQFIITFCSAHVEPVEELFK